MKFIPILLSSLLAVGAIAHPVFAKGREVMKMVMIDQQQLTATQREAFQRYLQTANLPRTQVGKRCQYYGKPQVWCLLLEPTLAQQVYDQLKGQPEFGSKTEIKEVRRIREAGGGREP